MTDAEKQPVVWQRVPQGWIELVAFADEEIARTWWQAYLAPARGLIDADALATMTRGFDAARDVLRESPYAVAGIFPYLVDDPTVFFIGTAVLPAPDDARAARAVAGLTGLVRFADDARTESFVALDGRTGTATLGRATTEEGATVAAIIGEVPLAGPGTTGTVFVLALSIDPERLDELAPYAALALDSTRLLPTDEAPAAYPPAEWLAAETADREA